MIGGVGCHGHSTNLAESVLEFTFRFFWSCFPFYSNFFTFESETFNLAKSYHNHNRNHFFFKEKRILEKINVPEGYLYRVEITRPDIEEAHSICPFDYLHKLFSYDKIV